MDPNLSDIPYISDEIRLAIINKNSIILNVILMGIFFTTLTVFILIFRDDKKRHSKDSILRKLLFIKRNT